MNDRRLSAMVLVFGVLVLAGGVIGGLKGSVASAGSGGAIGLGLVGCGAAMWAGRRAAILPAIALCFVTALAMAQRVTVTGKLVPGLPVGVLAVALTYVLLAERRRRALAQASGPRPAPPARPPA
ncbi:MAG: TMEM14 family protein [Planctomycetota bacterium]